MRGPNYKGFSKGGRKTAFFLGELPTASRIAITESAIDALSLASIEDWPKNTAYVSTGGGFGSETLKYLGARIPARARVVAATDQGVAGDMLAGRIRRLSEQLAAGFSRLRPSAKDWNEQLLDAGLSAGRAGAEFCTVQTIGGPARHNDTSFFSCPACSEGKSSIVRGTRAGYVER